MAANFGSMAGGVAASRFVKCFVANTPVAISYGSPINYYASPFSPAGDTGSSTWLACGLASLVVASLVAGDRKKRSREIPPEDESNSEGTWWIEKAPDLDVSELDFDDVCDELLTGSPGMG